MSEARDQGQDTAAIPFFGAKWACWLGGALLLGFTAVTASAIYDKAHLASLETVTEPTAVGDHAFVPLVNREPGMTVLTWNGHPLRLGDIKNISASDPDMLKAGMDDTRAFFIYTWSIPVAAKDTGVFYLKARDGEYLKVLR